MSREIDQVFQPPLLAAWSRPPQLQRLAAAVGAPLAYAAIRRIAADNPVLVVLQNAARLQTLRSAQTRRLALTTLAHIAAQGYACCAVGGFVSACLCYANPSYRLLPHLDLLATPDQVAEIATWLGAQGYQPARPLSPIVQQRLWARLEPAGFAPLHPARGNLRVRLLSRLPELELLGQDPLDQAVTMSTSEGPIALLSAHHHARYLFARVNGGAAAPAEWLRAVFDIAAHSVKHGDAALLQHADLPPVLQSTWKTLWAGLAARTDPFAESAAQLRPILAARLAVNGWADQMLLACLRIGSGVAAPRELNRPFQLERYPPA